jgi:hypothetical protein
MRVTGALCLTEIIWEDQMGLRDYLNVIVRGCVTAFFFCEVFPVRSGCFPVARSDVYSLSVLPGVGQNF